MSNAIQYFFTMLSPFCYLGHGKLGEVAARHGKGVTYRPIGLGGVWESSGAVPLGQRPQSRQHYRLLELQRWRDMRNLPLNLHPKHFPTSPALADKTVIAIVEAGGNPHAYMNSVYRAAWADELDIADPHVLKTCLDKAGFDSASLLAAAESDAIASIYAQNTQDGVALEILGAPAFVWQGEPFWGQDRLELLDAALASGRSAFKP